MNEFQEKIRQFLSDELLVEFDGDHLNEETNLFESGLVDSYGFVELVSHIEGTGGIKFSNDEIMNAEFSSLKGFAEVTERLVESRGESES